MQLLRSRIMLPRLSNLVKYYFKLGVKYGSRTRAASFTGQRATLTLTTPLKIWR